jgi:hypothetical protein
MSAPMTATTAMPARPRRAPLSLLLAGYLLGGAGALWTSAAIATLFAIPEFSRHYSQLRGDADAGPVLAVLLVFLVAASILAAAVTIPIAVSTVAGSPVARVLAWIALVPAAFVALILLLGDPYRAVPWHQRLSTAVAIATLIVCVATPVLLLRKASRAYVGQVRAARQARQAAVRAMRVPVQQPPYPPGPYPQPPEAANGPS